MAIDPATVITSVTAGLGLVESFRQIYLRWKGEKIERQLESVIQTTDSIQIEKEGVVTEEIGAEEFHLPAWDEGRIRALKVRIEINSNMFNRLWEDLPIYSLDERVRIEQRMERIKQELCEDFRELVHYYEQVLRKELPTRYHLYEVCG